MITIRIRFLSSSDLVQIKAAVGNTSTISGNFPNNNNILTLMCILFLFTVSIGPDENVRTKHPRNKICVIMHCMLYILTSIYVLQPKEQVRVYI